MRTRTSTTKTGRYGRQIGCTSWSRRGREPDMDRATALRRLRATVEAGTPIIGAGAGTGLSAKAAEMGGVDLIIIYISGRSRMAGRGSLSGMLAYGDANQVVVEMSREVLDRKSTRLNSSHMS